MNKFSPVLFILIVTNNSFSMDRLIGDMYGEIIKHFPIRTIVQLHTISHTFHTLCSLERLLLIKEIREQEQFSSFIKSWWTHNKEIILIQDNHVLVRRLFNTHLLMSNDIEAADVFNAIDNNATKILTLFLNNGVNPNLRNKDKRTLLHAAVCTRNILCAQLLLEKNADVNAIDKNGFTPLHHAVRHKGNITMIQLLIDKKADVNLKTHYTLATPLHYAAQKSEHAVRLLLKNNADCNAQTNVGKTPLDYAHASGTFSTRNI